MLTMELTAAQQRDVGRARALAAAIDGGRETITAYVLGAAERSYQATGMTLTDRRRELMTEDPYPEATGHAVATIRYLLEVIDDLVGAG
jgi:hypothetical protein